MLDLNSFNKYTEEVFHSNKNFLFLEKKDIENLQNYAAENIRQRARICSHKNSEELVQEMFIIHPKGAYVRPHKHINKIESMLILEGEVDFILFDELGNLEKKISMGSYTSGKPFYESMRTEKFHSLSIKSEWLFFLEITKGPFRKDDTIFAPWSPEESSLDEVNLFMKKYFKEE